MWITPSTQPWLGRHVPGVGAGPSVVVDEPVVVPVVEVVELVVWPLTTSLLHAERRREIVEARIGAMAWTRIVRWSHRSRRRARAAALARVVPGAIPSRRMRRSALLTLALALSIPAVAAVAGCATYTQDLERAQRHYDANEFEKSLALCRALEDDTDSFSAADNAKYAYLRGMTDYRLASVAAQGTNVADPRRAFRDNARHWLAVAQAIDKKTPGGMTPEQKQRLGEALEDLNRDVFGGAGEAAPASSAAERSGQTVIFE